MDTKIFNSISHELHGLKWLVVRKIFNWNPTWPPRSKNLQLLSKHSRQSVNLSASFSFVSEFYYLFFAHKFLDDIYFPLATRRAFSSFIYMGFNLFLLFFFSFFVAVCVRSSWLHFVGLCFGFWSYLQPFDGSNIEPPTHWGSGGNFQLRHAAESGVLSLPLPLPLFRGVSLHDKPAWSVCVCSLGVSVCVCVCSRACVSALWEIVKKSAPSECRPPPATQLSALLLFFQA